jgi:methionyl-tRNA formyltransferase
LGTINLHGSLLPRYRGAAPIHHAVLNGDTETGVTTFFLKHEIDTGHIIRQKTMTIGPDETTGEVYQRMMAMGARVLVETVDSIADGTAKAIPQQELLEKGHALMHAPKIFKEDARIDWTLTAAEIHNHVRGMNPAPVAFTEYMGKTLKVYKGQPDTGQRDLRPGEADTDKKTYLSIGCADGTYRLLEVQAEGKKRMGVEQFLRGQRW